MLFGNMYNIILIFTQILVKLYLLLGHIITMFHLLKGS